MKTPRKPLTAGFALLVLLLARPSAAPSQTSPDRSAPPKLGPPPQLHLPPLQHAKLSNGLPVLLMEKHQVPLVQVDLLVMAGSVDDPAGKEGLASMTASMMTEGAGTRNALELADAIDFLGASITPVTGYHTSAIELHTPLAKLDSALALMSDIVLRPRFAPGELERMRRDRLTELLQWRDEPPTLASIAFSRLLYDRHPYGRLSTGSGESLRSISAEDLRGFHDGRFRPNNATLIVVGDVTISGILPRLEQAFGSWEPRKVASVSLPAAAQVESTRVVIVDKPGAAQSEIRIGRIGAARNTEDYFPLVVLNTILGGSFTSRLNQNLREEHGYTYGAGSRFDFRLTPGPFLAGAAVQTDVTDKALAEFMKELHRIVEPVGEKEVARARNYVALGFPRDFEGVAQIAAQLEQMVVYHLPDEYFDTYVDRILAVKPEEVDRVARNYIDPSKLDVLIVGDRSKIAAGVEALHLAPVKFEDIDDVLGKAPTLEAQQEHQ